MNLPSSAIEEMFEKPDEETAEEPKEEKKSLSAKASEMIYSGIFGGKSKMAKGKYRIRNL